MTQEQDAACSKSTCPMLAMMEILVAQISIERRIADASVENTVRLARLLMERGFPDVIGHER